MAIFNRLQNTKPTKFQDQLADVANRADQGGFARDLKRLDLEEADNEAWENADMRHGKLWDEFMEKMRLRDIRSVSGDEHHVDSASGKTYVVRIVSRGDSLRMTCSCPAGRGCRHKSAVLDMLMAEAVAVGDYDCADWLERIEP